MVGGKKLKALFDIRSNRSYIVKKAISKPECCMSTHPFNIVLNKRRWKIKEVYTVIGEMNELPFDFSAYLIDDLGKVDGKEIDVLIGASTMAEWEIRFMPDKKELKLSGLKERKFTEF